ncbi:MAG: 30S ribosomal protein S13 [Patescibacteria group bacterium]|nr:30S ribosomal protein S13 [Patescibacteria group bacterium]
MLRIAGVSVPENKQIETSLTYIYGIGNSLSKKILKDCQISLSVHAKDLSQQEINKLKEIIDKNCKIEGDLRREKIIAIRRLKEIGCWRGGRHINGLPVRGQRTKTNSRTIRKNVKRTVGSGRKAPLSPK